MKWIWMIVLVLAIPLMVILIIGLLLPRKHTVQRSTSLHQSPDTVWGLISGPPSWRTSVQKYEELPPHDGHRMWRETDKSGQTITFEAIESAPPWRLVTRIADPKLPFGGTWTYEIAPTADGCTLTITEDGVVYNPVFRFVSRYIMGHAATVNMYLKAVHAKLG